MKILEAVTYTMGKELQQVGGRPVTFVTADFLPTSLNLEVMTTLGFPPDGGEIFVGGLRLTYTEAVTSYLNGIVGFRPRTIARGSYVVSSVRGLRPPSYELFWPNSPAAKGFYG